MNTQFIMTAGDIITLAALFTAAGLTIGFLIGWRPEGPRRRRPDVVLAPPRADTWVPSRPGRLPMAEVRPGPWPADPPALDPAWPAVGDTFSEQSAAWQQLERNVCTETRPFRAIR